MPKIPTILAEGNLQGTPLSPSAAPVSSGFDTLAGGLMDTSRATTDVASTMVVLDARRKKADEERWEGDALYQEIRHLNEWQADPENNSKETYAQDFLKYAEGRVKTYEESAPSERARRSIGRRLKSFVLERHDSALGVTERTRLNKSKESVISQTADSLNVYRSAQNVPGVDAIGEAEAARADIRDRTTKMFEGVDPTVARKLRGYVDAEFAIAMAAEDKEHALSVVDNSSDIAEEDKTAVRYKIDAMSRASDSASLDATERARQDHLATVEAGNSREKLPLAFYGQYKNPAHEKSQDDFRIDVLNDASDHVTRLAPMSVSNIGRELSKMESAVTTQRQALSLKMARSQLSQIAKAQVEDRVSWLLEYNPEVRSISTQMSGVEPGSDAWKTLQSARNEAIKKYQGRPVAPGLGTLTTAEFDKMMAGDVAKSEYFLGRATNDRALMTRAEARQNAGYVNGGTPEEVVARFNEIMANYPGEEDQHIAFSDMVNLPAGEAIRAEYQAVLQNKEQWFAESLTKALSDTKALGALTDLKRAELDKELNKNKTWLGFEQVMGGERAPEAKAFKDAVTTYANYLQVANGKSLSESVSTATKHVIDTTLGITKVNGRPMVISREREAGKPGRTDEEIQDIGRRLGVALSDVPVQVADQSRFSEMLGRIHPDEKNINRLQVFRDAVTKTGHWTTSNDGQSATLYVVGDAGIPFELHDKEGRAFRIHFDDLPKFMEIQYGEHYDEFGHEITGVSQKEVPIQPEKTYQLQKFPKDATLINRFGALIGVYQKKTYWPTNTYMRMTVPGK